jgi:peptide/nickel transport system permease protein
LRVLVVGAGVGGLTLAALLRRAGGVALTLLLASFVVFAVTEILPGDAAQMMLGEFATDEQLAALRARLGLELPWWERYGAWLGGVLTGDWGVSIAVNRPVAALVWEALSRSLVLAGASLVAVVALAVPLGVWAAVRRGRAADLAIGAVSVLGVSVPEFVTATLLLVALATPEIGLFPASGWPQDGNAPLGEYARHLVLPVAALTLVLTAHIVRQTRSEMVDTLATDFVRTATLKGLPRRRVLYRHALPNAMVPTVTVIALDVGYLIGGILVVEEIFAFPGAGRLMLFAIQNRDLPLMQGSVLALAVVYTLANLAADLVHGLLDPRVRPHAA